MTYREFQILHSEAIGYFQLIEGDLKWIYSLMHKGDVDENYDSLDKRNLGFIIKELKALDYSAGTPFISKDDYNFLNQMREKGTIGVIKHTSILCMFKILNLHLSSKKYAPNFNVIMTEFK